MEFVHQSLICVLEGKLKREDFDNDQFEELMNLVIGSNLESDILRLLNSSEAVGDSTVGGCKIG